MTSNVVKYESDELRVLARRLIQLLCTPDVQASGGPPLPQSDLDSRSGNTAPLWDTCTREDVNERLGKTREELDELVLRYPILPFEMPRLLQHQVRLGPKGMSTAINIRISLSLSLTLRQHIGGLQGVTQSEWIRDAVLAKLSAEQKEKDRRRSLMGIQVKSTGVDNARRSNK